MIKTIIKIPVISNGDWDSSNGYLQKEISHSVPLTVGLRIHDQHLQRIDDSGERKKIPIVEKVAFNIDEGIYLVATSEIEIQGKLLDRDKWEYSTR